MGAPFARLQRDRGGFQGEGAKTIIPARARAKISCRLVPHQEPGEIEQKVGEFLVSVAPKGVRVTVKYLHGGRPYLAPTDHPVFEVAKASVHQGVRAARRCSSGGGSIPFVRTIAGRDGKPCLLMGFGQPDENAHAPTSGSTSENYVLASRARRNL